MCQQNTYYLLFYYVLIPEIGDHLEAILVCAERPTAAVLQVTGGMPQPLSVPWFSQHGISIVGAPWGSQRPSCSCGSRIYNRSRNKNTGRRARKSEEISIYDFCVQHSSHIKTFLPLIF